MPVKTSIKQLFRTPIKLILYFAVSAMAAALLCIGLNMQANSKANIAAADAAFTTVAVPQLWGQTYKGYMPAAVFEDEYDLSKVSTAAGVQSVDVRGRFGAKVNMDTTLITSPTPGESAFRGDVIIFSVNEAKSITLPNLWGVNGKTEGKRIQLTVEYSAHGGLDYGESFELINTIPGGDWSQWQDFELGNENLDVTLEPGGRYIAILSDIFSSARTDGAGNVISCDVSSAFIHHNLYYSPQYYEYGENGLQTSRTDPYSVPYPPIAPYDDAFFESERGEFYQKMIDAFTASANSLTVITTDDAEIMLPLHSGGVHISSGRLFTEEEYETGARVCVMSEMIAELNGWNVGDTLPLSFYECDAKYYCTAPGAYTRARQLSVFADPVEGFFDEGEYTIIGLFVGNVESTVMGQYSGGSALDSVHVLIPKASVQNAPTPQLTDFTISIRLVNSEALDFMAEMESAGLTTSRKNNPSGYEFRLSIYDQGYSAVASGLGLLKRVSALTLAIACAVAGIAALLLSIVHMLRTRRDVAIMRSLGTRRGETAAIALTGIMLVCLIGACAGALAGHHLSNRVCEAVVEKGLAQAPDTAFSAMLGDDAVSSFDFIMQNNPSTALISAAAVALAFCALSFALLAAEYKKPPMLLLTKE